MDSADVERRRHVRHRVEAPAFLCSAVSSARSGARGHCLDLSEAGVGLMVAGSWQPGQVMQLELVLPRGEQPLMLAARLVHRNRLYCGMEFLGLTESARAQLRSALPAEPAEPSPACDHRQADSPIDPLVLPQKLPS